MPVFRGVTLGQLLTLLGYDGGEFRNLRTDEYGNVYIRFNTDLDNPVLLNAYGPTGSMTPLHTTVQGELYVTFLPGADPKVCIYGYTGTTWVPLLVTEAGHLQTDVLSSALPTGAATEQEQAWARAHLSNISTLTHALESTGTDTLRMMLVGGLDLDNALKSAGTDRYLVQGEDQIVTYKAPLGTMREATISGNNGYVDSDAVSAGEVWRVERIITRDTTTATTAHECRCSVGGTFYHLDVISANLAANVYQYHYTPCYLEAGEKIRIFFTGSKAGDTCRVVLGGFRFTKAV